VRPGGASDYSLHVDVRRFEVNVTDNVARIEMSARIVSDRTGRPVAAKVFSATTPADRTADGKALADSRVLLRNPPAPAPAAVSAAARPRSASATGGRTRPS
jgi:hypothetical protein